MSVSIPRYARTVAMMALAMWAGPSEAASAAPTMTWGTGAPAAAEPNGSVYVRRDGGITTTIYVRVAAAWTAVAVTGVDFGAGGLKTDVLQESTAGSGPDLDGSSATTGSWGFRLADNLAAALTIKEGANAYLTFVTTNGAEALLRGKPMTVGATVDLIADPGNAGAIPVTRSGVCALTTGAADTRTLAAPSFIGQRLALVVDVDGGTVAITVASAINQANNTIITMAEVKDFIELVAVQIAGVKAWRVAANDGAALS